MPSSATSASSDARCSPSPSTSSRHGRSARTAATARISVAKSFCGVSRPTASTTGGIPGPNHGWSSGSEASSSSRSTSNGL